MAVSSLASPHPPDRVRERPRLTLLSARGHDETWLRARARALSETGAQGHVSRSYCHPYAVLATHRAPTGVDIERLGADDPALLESIATPQELRHDACAAAGGVTSLWSSKEALAKALGDARDYDPRRLDSPALWVDGRSGPWCARRHELVAGYVTWVVWREDV